MNTMTMERPPLVSIVGTVVNISPAPAGNRSGKIKLDDGRILSAFADKLQMIEIGGTYDFGCVVTQKAGVNYHDVKAIRPAQSQQYSAPPRSQPSRVAPGETQRSAPVNQHVDPPRQPSNGNGNNGAYYRPTSPKDARRMFICSQMNALIQSHQIAPLNAQSIADAIAMLAEAYDATLGQEDAAA